MVRSLDGSLRSHHGLVVFAGLLGCGPGQPPPATSDATTEAVDVSTAADGLTSSVASTAADGASERPRGGRP